MANSSLSVILLVIYFTSFCFRYSVHDETVFFAGEVVSKNKEIRERVDSAVWYVLVSCRIFNFEDFLCRIWISHNHKFARFFPRNLEFCQILNSQHLSAESWVLLYLEFSTFALPNPEFSQSLNFQVFLRRLLNFHNFLPNLRDLVCCILSFPLSWIFKICVAESWISSVNPEISRFVPLNLQFC